MRGTAVTLTFTIPGIPRGKERPRFGRGGNVYTPARTRAYEAEIWAEALKAGGRQDMFPLGRPLWLSVQAYFTKPKNAAGDYPTGKPDISNIIKAIEDGLAPAMGDDAQIVAYFGKTGKFFGDSKRVTITLTDVNPHQEREQ